MNESYDFKREIYEREYGKRKGQEFVILTDIEETRYKELIPHSDVIFAPVMGKYMEKNLDITKPRYDEQILQFPWTSLSEVVPTW